MTKTTWDWRNTIPAGKGTLSRPPVGSPLHQLMEPAKPELKAEALPGVISQAMDQHFGPERPAFRAKPIAS